MSSPEIVMKKGLLQPIELLTREDEVLLGRAVQAGLAAEKFIKRGIGASNPIIILIYFAGRNAQDEFVEHNQGLVANLARRYLRLYSLREPMMEELKQIGNEGLATAIIKFDPERGNKFSTHATWWIRQKLSDKVRNVSRQLHLSEIGQRKLAQIKQAVNDFWDEYRRRPTYIEISQFTGLDPAEVNAIIQAVEPVGSLDFNLKEDGKQTLSEIVADPHQNTEDRAGIRVDNQIFRDNIQQALLQAGLDKLQVAIFLLEAGLTGDAKLTLKQIAKILQTSLTLVRKNRAVAIETILNADTNIWETHGLSGFSNVIEKRRRGEKRG